MQNWIASADTFFIASGYRSESDRAAVNGMDASHRGGAAGFVKVASESQLVFPDYAGNNHFNTIGNLVVDPRVGLLFVDFDTGSLLQISGRASIDWDSEEVARHPGAQRLVVVDIESIVLLNDVLPIRWSEPAGSIRSLRVIEKNRESDDVTSFVFGPRDDGELPDFEAGQHLPIEIRIDGHDQVFKRTYSLSNAPGEGRYRISVKREARGLVSRYLHDNVAVGDIINSKKPDGEFVLEHHARPAILISAGIGITPMVSMLHALVSDGSNRPVHFIHAARDGNHHALRAEVRDIASRSENVHLTVVYSQPGDNDLQCAQQGRLDGSVIDNVLADLDADFYLCGPTRFLADIAADLTERGVNATQIHAETFGSTA